MDLFLTYAIRDWIYKVQSAYNRGEVKDEDSLKRNALVDWQTHSRIFDLLEFSLNRGGFTCRIKLKPLYGIAKVKYQLFILCNVVLCLLSRTKANIAR